MKAWKWTLAKKWLSYQGEPITPSDVRCIRKAVKVWKIKYFRFRGPFVRHPNCRELAKKRAKELIYKRNGVWM